MLGDEGSRPAEAFERRWADYLARPAPACSEREAIRLLRAYGNYEGDFFSFAPRFFPLISAGIVPSHKYVAPHEEMLRHVSRLLKETEVGILRDGFLYGITHKEGRRYWAAFLAYHYLGNLPPHEKRPYYADLEKKHLIKKKCGFCGFEDELSGDVAWRLFETSADAYFLYCADVPFSFGIDSAIYSLSESRKFPVFKPCEEDMRVFLSALRTAETLSPEKKCGAYKKALKESGLLNMTTNEIVSFINTLGMLNILHPPGKAGYAERFTPECEREEPGEQKNDYAYPVNLWRAKDGVDYAAVEKLFGFSPRY